MTQMNQNRKDTEKAVCAHCSSEVNPKRAIKEDDKYFCCEGCRSVYHLINDEGFGSFYTKRTDWEDAPPAEQVEADEEYFQTSIKPLKNGDLELSIVISGIRCAACVWLIESSAQKDERIKMFRINYANHKAKIIFNPQDISVKEVLQKITRLGYCPLPSTNIESIHDKERKDYFYRFGVAAFFTMQVMMYSIANYTGYFKGMDENLYFLFKLLSWALATPVLLYSAAPFFQKSFAAIKHFHFTMDTLVALGAGTSYLYSVAAIFLGYETYFDTSVMIITLILLGRFIEAGAKQKGSNAVAKLLSLKPKNVKKALKDENGEYSFVTIPIEQLNKDELFEISAGNNVAADGKIISGFCEIDESMLTGEPMPVEKQEGAEVYAGTKVINGTCIVMAERVGQDSFLSKIAASVDDAQSSKAPIQDVADNFIGKFVPFVLIVALSTFLYWYLFASNGAELSIMRAVSVLVIACPCAMGLATPLAIISSSAKLSETGIIFKNGEAIERFAYVNDFYFDKTGTITKGDMSVSEYKLITNCSSIINLITSAAFYSKHPASKAISLLNNELFTYETFEEKAGEGIDARIKGNRVLIGSRKFLTKNNILISKEYEEVVNDYLEKGLTLVFVSVNSIFVGIYGISDTIRQEAADTIAELQKSGNTISIITGDNEKSAGIILGKAGINANIIANVSPFDKGKILQSAVDTKKTVMIGDGINDAIALTSASVGISMRNSTDISMESASAVLLRNDLSIISKSHKICKKTLKIIKENLFWAFSYNIIAIPLAVSGLIHPVMSAAFMSFSSLFVVTNSMRIRK